MSLDFTNAGFYLEEERNKHKIVKEVHINTLPECEEVKDYYVIRLFDDDYSAIYNYKKKMYMKPHISCEKRIYWRYGLQTNDKKVKHIRLHRIVALAFVDGYRGGHVVNHIDIERPSEIAQLDNRPHLLEWVTQGINARSDKKRKQMRPDEKMDNLLLSLTDNEREILALKLSI